MLSFYLIWSLSYFSFLWWMSRFWSSKQDESVDQTFIPVVTLIIPFRNEAKNIPSVCLNLQRLNYPDLQVLLIDDQSEDDSFQLMKKCFKESRNIKVIRSEEAGKKNALELGVKLATSHIVLCSDADCQFSEAWIEKMMLPFQDTKIQLVAGTVLVQKNCGFLAAFQSLDWASILLMTNYSFVHNNPLMCSGANLAYRKAAFEKVKGYEGNREIASGDDEFLLKKIHKEYGKEACHYLISRDSLVTTKPEPTWNSLLNQRIRWASKWKAHFSISHALSAGGAFLTQLIWISSLYLIFLGAKGILVFGLVWLIKIAAEKLSLGKVLNSLGSTPSSISVIQTSLVHPFYVLRVGIAALSGKFTWKAREN